jgi:hypothetical protein
MDGPAGVVLIIAGIAAALGAEVPDALGGSVVAINIVVSDYVLGSTTALRRAGLAPIVLASVDRPVHTVNIHRVGVVELLESIEVLYEVLLGAVILAVVAVVLIAIITRFATIDNAIWAVRKLAISAAGVGKVRVACPFIALLSCLHDTIAATVA